MTKDIGIVFFPDKKCKDFAEYVTNETRDKLSGYEEVTNNPHISAYHMANVYDFQETELKKAFKEFCKKYSNYEIYLNVKDIKATGGSPKEGYKYLDIQFKDNSELNSLYNAIVKNFYSFHNGTLDRMYDDMANFNKQQLEEIQRYGTIVRNYVPHVTTWYIDLPNEDKATKLKDIADDLQNKLDKIECNLESIALVELGRNGNAINIIDEYSLS